MEQEDKEEGQTSYSMQDALDVQTTKEGRAVARAYDISCLFY